MKSGHNDVLQAFTYGLVEVACSPANVAGQTRPEGKSELREGEEQSSCESQVSQPVQGKLDLRHPAKQCLLTERRTYRASKESKALPGKWDVLR